MMQRSIFLCLLDVGQARQAQHLRGRGIYRDDPSGITAGQQVGDNIVADLARSAGRAEHGDGFRGEKRCEHGVFL
jgi:hypothetical protein